jgi:hypothetical protein
VAGQKLLHRKATPCFLVNSSQNAQDAVMRRLILARHQSLLAALRKYLDFFANPAFEATCAKSRAGASTPRYARKK